MEEQMKPFEDGGLRDEGGMVDKESGNKVPTGSTKKEVRDDIPAMLSEGEFVLPADVVRYHGLEKIMQLRDEAKFGLKKMEAMGQMGNSEKATLPDDTPFKGMPFGMEDLLIVEVGKKEKKETKEKYNGGAVKAAEGTFVGQPVDGRYLNEDELYRRGPGINPPPIQLRNPTGIAGYAPSMYSTESQIDVPDLTTTLPDPASSVINIEPTQPVSGGPIPAPVGGYQPLFYTGEEGEPIVDVPIVTEPVIEEPENFIVPTDQLPTDEATADVGEVSVSTAQVSNKDDNDGGTTKKVIDTLKSTADKIRRDEYNQKLNSGDGDTLLDMYAEANAVSKFGGMGASFVAGLPGLLLTRGAVALQKRKIAEKLDAVYGEGKWQDKVKNITAKDLLGKVKEEVQNVFTAEGRKNYYDKYTSKYDVSLIPLSDGAEGYKKDANGVVTGNLSVREQRSFDAAVDGGNTSVINHFASIARLRKKQDAYAESGYDYAIGVGLGLSMHDMEQAEKYEGSIHTAITEGRAEKEEGIAGIFKPVKKTKEKSNAPKLPVSPKTKKPIRINKNKNKDKSNAPKLPSSGSRSGAAKSTVKKAAVKKAKAARTQKKNTSFTKTKVDQFKKTGRVVGGFNKGGLMSIKKRK